MRGVRSNEKGISMLSLENVLEMMWIMGWGVRADEQAGEIAAGEY